MLQISEPYTSKRSAPVNSAISDEILFKHEEECQVDPVYLIEIKNLLFSGTGLFLVPEKRKLPKLFLKYNNLKQLSFLSYPYCKVKLYLKHKLIRINRPVVFVIDCWSYGYFHWMAEVLPRLIVAGEAIKDTSVVLPAHYKNLLFVEASLRQLGFKYLFLDEQKIYCIKHLRFVSHFAITGNFNDIWINKLRGALGSVKENEGKRKKIYISRRHTKRFIINEEIILPILESFGFDIVFAEQLSFAEQQKLFAAADVLISNHGAGLTNMLFMQPDTKVIEIRNGNDNHNNCYFSLASALNLSYYYLKASPVETKEDSHNWNLAVDILELKYLLELVLNG